MLLPILQQPVLNSKILKISPAEATKNTSQTLTSSTCLTLTSNRIFVSTNSMDFVFPSRTPTLSLCCVRQDVTSACLLSTMIYNRRKLSRQQLLGDWNVDVSQLEVSEELELPRVSSTIPR
ncbi:hypothetical protein TNCV_452791 [Trichonephila clavipes]|nr:hypothetical protein TNCV_452791 [Trichonephila clavipes]